jgi:hypothetical protein
MFWSFLNGKNNRGTPRDLWPLSRPLLRWSGDDVWTIGSACEGTLCLGATGSGKSTGSGRAMALAMLRAGFGGLVLTAKADERRVWESYCRETKRTGDLIVFGPNNPYRFNFLDYELNRKGDGAGLTENIVQLFSTILEVAERGSGSSGGREDENYWKRANRQLMRNAIDLLALGMGRISVPDLYRLVISAPSFFNQINDECWQKESFCFQLLKEADRRAKTEVQRRDFGIVADYFLLELVGLSEKTKSVILSTFTSMADLFLRGVLRDLFSAETNLTPEAVQAGKIVLIDMPCKEFGEVGQFAQVLWKYAFQRCIERRDVRQSPRPTFLWADEAQHFVTSYDMQFQTTCRAARVATVLLSQNVSNFYAALGGSEKGKAEATSLFANLNTKVFHAQADPVTNEWAASLMGRTRQMFANGNTSYSPDDYTSSMMGFSPAGNTSAGFSESMEFEVQPSVFTQLRTGGLGYKGMIDAIVFQNGRRFHETGRTWLPVTFTQKF